MQYIRLGKTGLNASRLGCGCSRIASLSTAYPPSEVRRTLLSAFDNGINFFDTANIYGQGDSERMLGKLFRDKRDQVILSTKAGLTLNISQSFIRLVKPFANAILRNWTRGRKSTIAARKQRERQCFDPINLKRQIEGSLQRLETDYLDIFMLHSPPIEIIKDKAVFEMLGNLKQAGLIRFIGVSCDTPENAIAAASQGSVQCMQIPVNLMESEMIKSVLPDARANGIGVISREPFAGGALLSHPALKNYHTKHSKRPPIQAALKYSMEQDDSSVVLVGMTCARHLKENLNALSAPPLSRDEIKALENISGNP